MAIPRFWRETPSRYNLIGTKCKNCDTIYFPPRLICPKCHRKSIGKLEPIKLKGEGEVITYTVIHDGPKQFEMQIPYVMAIIELDEGVRLTAQIVECEPNEIKIGMRVKSTFRKLGEDGKAGVIHYGYKFIKA